MQGPTLISQAPATEDLPRPGDYLCSDRSLYRVERMLVGRALIEDCRTEEVLDVSLPELLALKPVRRTADGDGED